MAFKVPSKTVGATLGGDAGDAVRVLQSEAARKKWRQRRGEDRQRGVVAVCTLTNRIGFERTKGA